MAFAINVAAPEEAALFYSNTEKDKELGCIGHLRGDFGHGGKEFWSTWWEHQGDLKTQAFKDEFNVLVNSLRKQGLLKDRSSMAAFCHAHPDARIPGAWHPDVFGFRVDTGRHLYYIRCFPHGGDYNFYIYCYINEKERLREQAQSKAMQPVPTKKRREPER